MSDFLKAPDFRVPTPEELNSLVDQGKLCECYRNRPPKDSMLFFHNLRHPAHAELVAGFTEIWNEIMEEAGKEAPTTAVDDKTV